MGAFKKESSQILKPKNFETTPEDCSNPIKWYRKPSPKTATHKSMPPKGKPPIATQSAAHPVSREKKARCCQTTQAEPSKKLTPLPMRATTQTAIHSPANCYAVCPIRPHQPTKSVSENRVN